MSRSTIRIRQNLIELPGTKRIASRQDLEGNLILEDQGRDQKSIQEPPTVDGLLNLLICSGEGNTRQDNPVINRMAQVVESLGVELVGREEKLQGVIDGLRAEVAAATDEGIEKDKKVLQLSSEIDELLDKDAAPILLSAVVRENHDLWLASGDRSYSPHNVPWDELGSDAKDQIAGTARNTCKAVGVAFDDDLALEGEQVHPAGKSSEKGKG